jgi:hypothetical protein
MERARADKDLQKHVTAVLNAGIPPKQTPEEFANFIDHEFTKELARNVRRK